MTQPTLALVGALAWPWQRGAAAQTNKVYMTLFCCSQSPLFLSIHTHWLLITSKWPPQSRTP